MGQELMNKMGGEFMSLGFIAFMIFCRSLIYGSIFEGLRSQRAWFE